MWDGGEKSPTRLAVVLPCNDREIRRVSMLCLPLWGYPVAFFSGSSRVLSSATMCIACTVLPRRGNGEWFADGTPVEEFCIFSTL